jgi:hypothetical protein
MSGLFHKISIFLFFRSIPNFFFIIYKSMLSLQNRKINQLLLMEHQLVFFYWSSIWGISTRSVRSHPCNSATNNSNSNGDAKKKKKINDGDQKVRKKSEGLLRTSVSSVICPIIIFFTDEKQLMRKVTSIKC